MSRILAGTLAVLMAFTAWAAEPFEKALPAETLAFLTVRNVPEATARIRQHGVYQVWQEPSVQRFLSKALEKLNVEVQKAEGQTGVKLEEMASLLHGQIALAVGYDRESDELELLLLGAVGEKGPRAMEIVRALVKAGAAEAEGAARALVEEDFEGVRLVHVASAPEGGAKGTPDMTFGAAGDVFLMGRPVKAVQRMVTSLKTPPPAPLAQSAGYAAALNKVSSQADFFGYVDIGRIVALAGEKGQGTPVPQVLTALGVDGAPYAALGVELGAEYAVGRLFLARTGPARGIVKVLMPAPGPLHAGEDAPADAASFLSARLDLIGLYDEFEKGMALAAPQILAAINMQIGQAAQRLGEPFNIRNDILSVFGQRITVYTRYELPYRPRGSEQMVVALDITGKAAFEQALDKLRRLSPQAFAMLQSREYAGHAVYQMAMPAMPPEMRKPAFAVTEERVLFSNDVAALEAHLRRLGKDAPSLAGRAEFQEGLRALPAENRVLIGFQDPALQAQYLIEMLKSPEFQGKLGALAADPDTAKVVELFDLSLLPDPKDVTKHLTPTTSVAAVQEDGVLMVSRSRMRAAGE